MSCVLLYFGPVHNLSWGHAMAQLIEALPYKLEGRGFVSRWGHWKQAKTHPGL
jgi:hypothetical protein